MDEKTELSAVHPTEMLESVDSTIEGGIDAEEPTTDTKNDDINEEAGITEQVESNNEQEAEPTNDPTDASNENTLISELNDVPLSTTVNSEAVSFLDSLTSENTPVNTESPISDEPAAVNVVAENPDISTDISMPSLTLSDEPPSIHFVNLEEKSEETDESKDVTIREKDPVCTLEEELQRMHEGDPILEPTNDEKVEDEKSGAKDEKFDVKMNKTENNAAPIMKDSDLEEMLAAEEVVQDPTIIKDSQEELKQIDILVCGKCHEVFNLVEEFQEHKAKKCNHISKVLPSCMLESKPQVWAFALWKSKQVKLQSEKGTSRTQWELYKDWCNLAQTEKDSWISAGENLQYCQKLGTAKLTEIKVQKAHADGDKDPLSLDGFDSNKENSTFDNSKSPLLEVKRTVINKPKAVPIVQKTNNEVNSNKAMRTVQTKDKSEYAVEKIVAKRFNPKKKTLEYQIKWEHFSSEDNTWEPLANLNHCKQMVDEFEEQLKKLKAEKAKQQAMALAKNSPKIKPALTSSTPTSSSTLISTTTGNRPQRTSKQKALDQVKAWCGNISDDENVTGIKRSRSPDSDDSFEKRLKFDDLSDDSETETKPKIQFRKIAPKPITTNTSPVQILKNGIGKNTPLPQNILIPDANGVVRINQKQLPSLSTGVYIMSKTAGIIKLDSDTSKVATSGGQTIVKVAPKIGQTQIKIMKKDGTSTQRIVQMSPKNIPTQKAMKTHLARAQKLVTEIRPSHQVVKRTPEAVKKSILNKSESEKRQIPIKKLPELVPKQNSKSLGKSKESVNQKDDESDDGLEELPFPDEIKIPEPDEEENTEFTLDPETGKIAGMEYPDPEPEPEPTEETKSDSSLDNIVKLAAADITEEDLKNEPQDPVDIEMHNLLQDDEEAKIVKTEPQHIPEKRFATASPMKPVVKMSVTPRKVAANPSSILNKALTGPHVVRRTVGGPPSQRLQQKIINPSISRSPQVMNPVVRQVNTYVRTKPMAPKPKFNVASEPPKFIRPNHNTSPKNVYSYTRQVVQNSPSVRKIGNTTVRSSNMMGGQQQKMQSKLVRTSSGIVQRIVSPARKEPMVIRGQPERIERKITPQKPKTVISMPSLMSDDELLLTSKTPQKRKQEPTSIQISAPEVNEHEQIQQIQQMEEQPTAMIETPIITHQQESDEISREAQTVATLSPDMSSFTLADNENPIFITGDDGTVYQVAGQNEQGQTILLTQGSDGQQQCLLVTNEVAEAMETSGEEATQAQPEISIPQISPDVTEPLSVKTDPVESSDQVVAQVVRAEPPSPGGTHKVVVMLPDGNLMVTQVSPEEYASLELE